MAITVDVRMIAMWRFTRSMTCCRSVLDLEHLGNRRQMLEHLTAVALADLEGGESGHPVAERLGFDLGREACDDTPLDQSVQARLRGRPGDAEPARQLQHAHPGLGVQLTQ